MQCSLEIICFGRKFNATLLNENSRSQNRNSISILYTKYMPKSSADSGYL